MISHDVRFALRLMQKSPGFTAVAVISLALGIGANTAIFSLINAIMLRQMPVERPDQLVEFIQKRPGYDRNDDYEATALTGVCFLEALPAGPHMADASAAVCDGRL